MNPIPGVKPGVSWRHAAGGKPQNGIESGHGVESPVEAEDVFIEIRLQMVLGDSTMMGSKNPSFEV